MTPRWNRFQPWLWRILFGYVVLGTGISIWAMWCFRADSRLRQVPLFQSIDMAVLPDLQRLIRESKQITVIEGLPHPGWEKELWKQEKAKPRQRHDGFYFYSETIVPRPAAAELFRKILIDPATFGEWRGMKMCGGYHPDFAIEFRAAAGEPCRVFLCFGCGEARLHAPGLHLYCELSATAEKQLEETLSAYHKKRPAVPVHRETQKEEGKP